MVEKLSVTIALEGGKEVERQLKGIGEAGQKAFLDISQAAQAAGGFKNLKPEEVTAKLKEMGIVGAEALKKITTAVETATEFETVIEQTKKTEARVAALGVAFKAIGVAAAAALAAVVKGAVDAAVAINKIDKAAIEAGMSIEKFEQLRMGFEKMGMSGKGVESTMTAIGKAAEQAELDQIAKSLKFLQDATKAGISLPRQGATAGVGADEMSLLVEAAQGGGKAADEANKALKTLGVTLAENTTKTLPQFINKFGDTNKAVAAFVEQMRAMPDGANRAKAAIAALGSAAGVELVQALRTGKVTPDQFKERAGGLTQKQIDDNNKMIQSFNQLNSTYERLKTNLLGGIGELGLTRVLEGFNFMLTEAKWSDWVAAGKLAISNIVEGIQNLAGKLADFAMQLGGDIWEIFKSAGLAAIDAIIAKLREAAAWAAKLFTGSGASAGTGSTMEGHASGGLIGGRGSGTSDSNLAWVSRGEHIMPARAVQQPGVLALLEALRRTGGNLRGVMDGMGRFALGGVVPQLPRFAEGGLVGGMQHLGTVDLRTDHGTARLMASSSAVEQLTRLAVTKRMTSTGKKPGFIG